MPETATKNGEMINRVQQLRLDSQLGNSKSGGGGGGAVWLPWILCVLMAVTWAGVGVRGYRNPGSSDGPSSNVATVANTSGTGSGTSTTPAPVAPASGTIELDVKGYLVPARQIAVSPIDVAGRVVELNVVEGKLFKKGDVLAKIEDINFVAQMAEAEAGLASAQRRLEASKARLSDLMPKAVRSIEREQMEEELREAKAQKARAEDEINRFNRLSGTASEQEVRRAQFDLQGAIARVKRLEAGLAILNDGARQERIASAAAEVSGAEADIKAAEARVAQAKWRLDNCIIRAPIDGTALSKKAELFNLVNPLANVNTSGSVCDLADLADLEVDLEIPERDIFKLRVGQKCRIRADAYSTRSYDGRLDRIMPIANRSKSVVSVRVKVKLPANEIPGTYLKPEMGAVVSFLADEKPADKQ